MIVIFEGPDNVGKTTQISLLKKKDEFKDFKVIHSQKPKNWKKEYFEEFKKFDKENIIYDRLHGGEVVYGAIYRNTNEEEVYELEEIIKNKENVYLIVLIDEVENLLKREDGKSITNDYNLKRKEVEKFKDFFEKSKIKNKILINVKNYSISDVNEIILSFLKYCN